MPSGMPAQTTTPRRPEGARSRFPASASWSSRNPYGRGGSPDGQGEEEVDDVDGDDGGPDRSTDSHPDAGRPALGGVAVIAVDQHDDQAEHQRLRERPQHVAGREEEMEVVVVR